MDTFEPKTSELPVAGDTQQELESLRHLVVSVMILVIVVSGTLNIYFLRQMRDARRELNRVRPQAAQVMAQYQKSEAPMMQTIINKLTEYGRTHVDYAPILSKYGIKGSVSISPTAAPAVPPAAATPGTK